MIFIPHKLLGKRNIVILKSLQRRKPDFMIICATFCILDLHLALASLITVFLYKASTQQTVYKSFCCFAASGYLVPQVGLVDPNTRTCVNRKDVVSEAVQLKLKVYQLNICTLEQDPRYGFQSEWSIKAVTDLKALALVNKFTTQ